MSGLQVVMDARATRFLSNRAQVESWVREAALLFDMTILSVTGYDLANAQGQDPGISVLALIAESHISVHTWPERGIITVDVYSCRGFDADRLVEGFRRTFGVTEILREHRLERFGITDSSFVKIGQKAPQGAPRL